MSTPYHAKFFAHELTLQRPSDSIDKLASSLSDIRANVALNPHQVDAALFAFSSPLSKGAILADEVGLGKTIEAGIVLSQKWAERRRRLLIIVPANLRKQWSQELADKFFLPSVILEAKSFKEHIKAGNLNPFEQPAIVICSYHFARNREPYVGQVKWDLVVIDEAHRLRNVYKPTAKIANVIRTMLAPFRKLLLTATPLQNSLMELYGLVSFIDEHTFGDLASFKAQYAKLTPGNNFDDLKERLKPICQRTLRRQVLEYISYTERIALTQPFEPSDDEQRLYDLVTEYLQRPSLYALPSGQRQLMTLILRRLLASSTFAISGTLDGLAQKLQGAADKVTPVDAPPPDLADNFEGVEEIIDEWDEEGDDDAASEKDGEERPKPGLTEGDLPAVRAEITQLREFAKLAQSIVRNSKGERLMSALQMGFAKARELHGPEKAIIFTESTRTQVYLKQVLEAHGFTGKIVLFNGTNKDPESKAVYRTWVTRHAGTDHVTGSPTADMRAALVEFFRDEAVIMIATEAAAEGINLQFCSLVINYDLPWNPQRIEQRIGRCHRYGQKFDVVVVNFLNTKNAADQRVYELLRDKFQLFSGVFGASDEVLGAIESGLDFEKRIANIYQQCRTTGEIQTAFDFLQKELGEKIDDRMRHTRKQLLENFDQEVSEKLILRTTERDQALSRFEETLWTLTRWFLRDHAEFDDARRHFTLRGNPFDETSIHPGPYSFGAAEDATNLYRIGHPLAQRILKKCRELDLPPRHLCFSTSGSPKIAILAPLVNLTGWLRVARLNLTTLETVEYMVFAGVTDSGTTLDAEQCRRLFSLSASEVEIESMETCPAELLDKLSVGVVQGYIGDSQKRDLTTFEIEINKLDRWAEDKRAGLKSELGELDDRVKELKRAARLASNLPEKLRLEKDRKAMEAKHDEAWRIYEEQARAIDREKDKLLDETQSSLAPKTSEWVLFTVRWTLQN
jgi:superfamily II DNA or RNA helicase